MSKPHRGVAAPRSDTERGQDLIPIAEVDRPRGLAGEVVVTVHADDPGRMGELESVLVPDAEGNLQPRLVESVKRLGSRAVIKLSGIESPAEARSIVGRVLYIPVEASTPPPEGRHFAYQLEGLSVRTLDGDVLGRVREILRPGPQSLLVVDGERGEILIPAVKPIVVEVDLEAGELIVDPPAGLLDVNAGGGKRG